MLVVVEGVQQKSDMHHSGIKIPPHWCGGKVMCVQVLIHFLCVWSKNSTVAIMVSSVSDGDSLSVCLVKKQYSGHHGQLGLCYY